VGYKIIEYEGCMSGGISVNGTRTEHMQPEEYNTFIDALLSSIKTGLADGTVSLSDVIHDLQYDEYKSNPDICDQCGDSTTETYWEI